MSALRIYERLFLLFGMLFCLGMTLDNLPGALSIFASESATESSEASTDDSSSAEASDSSAASSSAPRTSPYDLPKENPTFEEDMFREHGLMIQSFTGGKEYGK